MIDDRLLARLACCHTATIVLREGRAAFDHTTTVYADGVTRRTQQHVPAVPARARVKLVRIVGRAAARRWVSVNLRTRRHETLDALVRRALDTLDARERDGMPRPNAATTRRRQLRKLLDRADTSGAPS